MQLRKYGDAGQAFPIYITVVAGLLFLAFAFLAVGQAAATRNGAQTAADAAALAAAQDKRDQLAGMWLKNVLDPSLWQEIFDGRVQGLDPSCWRAQQFADRNDAHVVPNGCNPVWFPMGYEVEIKTDKPVGDSIVPGTERKYANARATAVIVPRCQFESTPPDDGGTPSAEPTDPPSTPGDPGDPGSDKGKPKTLPELECKGKSWHLDPEHLTDLPGPEDLFDVHLAD
ncbi:pilus assembly protein TadG-related protein [Streptomyces sp. NPDC002004]